MPITDWPLKERPREKLLSLGAQALSEAELLAIFLRTGRRGKTAVDLARDILNHFGGLRKLFGANYNEFCAFPGIGVAKFTQLQAVLELSRRHLAEQLKQGDALTDPAMTRQYLTARLREYQYEVFACLFLDNQHRILGFEELFRGTINGASVHPREVVRQALEYNAAAVIFSHNHPSGVAEASEADRSITRHLQEALKLIDIRVLDHIIIGNGESVAFTERGWL
jgi:DNA repair protein RadC